MSIQTRDYYAAHHRRLAQDEEIKQIERDRKSPRKKTGQAWPTLRCVIAAVLGAALYHWITR